MATTTYLGNPALKDLNVKVQWTKEKMAEYIKCAEEPVYFITKYVKVVTLDEGVTDFKLWPFQVNIVQSVHEDRYTICLLPRQSGKCLESTTYITIRNKNTRETKKITIGSLFENLKS